MDVVKVWNGRYACALQGALRLTNEAFAGQLGISVRTVATWHADPELVPRAEIQQLLDTVHENATESVSKRFTLIVSSESPARENPSDGHPGEPQALRVAIAIVARESEVLLVCRRGDDPGGITWQFPAGVVKPGSSPEVATVRETLSETGVHCSVRQNLGSRIHPITGVMCDYFLCDYLTGEARNSDVLENVDVMWVLKDSVTRFIEVSSIYPPVLAFLEDARD